MVAGGVIGTTAAIFRWADMGENNVESATIASILPALVNDLILILISIFGLIYLLLVHQLTKIQVIGFSSILLILGLAVGGVTLGLHFRDQTVSVFIWVSRQSNKIRRSHLTRFQSLNQQNIFLLHGMTFVKGTGKNRFWEKS